MIHTPRILNPALIPKRKTAEEELKESGLLELAVEAGMPVTNVIKCALDSIITNDGDTINAKREAEILATNPNINVLIIGDTGTGKELFARVIHGNSRGKLVGINTAGIPDGLLESELFGCVPGGFTGAGNRKGLIEEAQNGTLFLDEIGDMIGLLQSKLLRAIQEKVFRRVGSNEDVPFNCRIVAATNRPLDELQSGKHGFRSDLFYRIAGAVIQLKPLKQRGNDWIDILRHLLDYKLTQEEAITITQELCENEWNGNIRELMNWAERYKTFKKYGAS